MDQPNDGRDEAVNTNKLPEKEFFERKEVHQFKQPADTDIPLEDEDNDDAHDTVENTENKTSKGEGLNEAQTPDRNGSYDGGDDQGEKI